jgi:hypothetical protein
MCAYDLEKDAQIVCLKCGHRFTTDDTSTVSNHCESTFLHPGCRGTHRANDKQKAFWVDNETVRVSEYEAQKRKAAETGSTRAAPPSEAQGGGQTTLNSYHEFRRVTAHEQRQIDRHIAALVPENYMAPEAVTGGGMPVGRWLATRVPSVFWCAV